MGSGKLLLDRFLSAEKQVMSSKMPAAPASPSLMVNIQAKKAYSIAEKVVVDYCGKSRDGVEDDDGCLSLDKPSGSGGLMGLKHSSLSSPPFLLLPE